MCSGSNEQLVPLSLSHASGLARICIEDDGLAGPCTDNVGVAHSVGALLLIGGGACLILHVF